MADNNPGTEDDNLRLQAGSPCIDSADGDEAPESDFAGIWRIDDSTTPNTGVGNPTYADRGAYEFGDSDFDGMPDSWENQYGFNPNDKTDADEDFDGDGFTNREEYLHNNLDPTDKGDPGIDADYDGFINIDEKQLGTDPFNYDSDGDLLPDGYEWEFGINPVGLNFITTDFDIDLLTLIYEVMFWTNPNFADSDGDGTNDYDEVEQGSNPMDASDSGLPPSGDICQIELYLDDTQPCPTPTPSSFFRTSIPI